MFNHDDPATLELSLRREDATHFDVELVFSLPGSEADTHPLKDQLVTVRFDHERLDAAWPDVETYGKALGEMLLGQHALAEAFAACRAAAQSNNRTLRLRLAITSDAPELHALHWETLYERQSDQPLALSEQLILVRGLSSADWRPVTLRAKDKLRALVVIATPAGLIKFQLAPLDVATEERAARAGLGTIPIVTLSASTEASLPTMIARLREGFDILYLVAHGALIDGKPYVFLDDGRGQAARIPGVELAASIADLAAPPRLIVLASCQSAGDRGQNPLAALGPRLATAGIPAVVAAQGPLSIETNRSFARTFFQELDRDGRIDRAMAVARQQVAARSDWWVPALFTRLRSGRIWYEPRFDDKDFQKWPALVSSIARGKCTPILGPGLLDRFIGSTRDLARRLAKEHHFPLAPFARDNLPQVAQYLAVNQGDDFLLTKLTEVFESAIATYADQGTVPPGAPDAQLATIGARERSEDASEPHRILARLRLPIYLTANPDRLLVDALREAGAEPQVLICPWNRHSEQNQTSIEPPSVERPLVYHLFGRLDDPDSLVLTEDDYFSYLIGVTRNQELLPKAVGNALVNTALLFLGFRLDDWNFRVLFQSVMKLEGRERLGRYTHVAVQIDPQEGAMLNPHAAREYLKSYFGDKAALKYRTSFSIYWGSAEDFLRELATRYDEPKGVA